ncbi:MAG: S-adenosylmethionine decarboxylase [Candidatus Poseidoniaceae archaeon]|nr:S-adenosylmethionine decarboxylase [Candidatus Poseidoniaceae archaeon]
MNAKAPLASHGQHVVLDLTGYVSPGPEEGAWVLNVLRDAVARSGAREVHAHVESFDGVISPPGFAAVVLLDESHLSAHCYSDRGWLAIDCFTCGGTNAEGIVEDVLNAFTSEMPDLVVHQRAVMNRFLHPEEG